MIDERRLKSLAKRGKASLAEQRELAQLLLKQRTFALNLGRELARERAYTLREAEPAWLITASAEDSYRGLVYRLRATPVKAKVFEHGQPWEGHYSIDRELFESMDASRAAEYIDRAVRTVGQRLGDVISASAFAKIRR